MKERIGTLMGGTALIKAGLRRRTFPGLLLALAGGGMVYRGISGHCGLYSSLGINTARRGPARPGSGAAPEQYFNRGIHVEQAVTVNRPPADLYAYWKNLEHLPLFMKHLESVRVLDNVRSHWTAAGPAGMHVEWDAEIINDEPDRLIAWRSLADAQVDNAGSVNFAEAGNHGTEVRVVLDYIPPAGRIGATFARLFGEAPDQQVRDDLRRFKQLMEAGEIATIQGQPSGT
jgi:uncharacterized membrane protein